MTEKPPTQRVAAAGFESHRGMGSMTIDVAKLLAAALRDQDFRRYVAERFNVTGDDLATPIFSKIGASCWADLKQPAQAQALAKLMDDYCAARSAAT